MLLPCLCGVEDKICPRHKRIKLTMQETIDTTPDDEGLLIIPDLSVTVILPDKKKQRGHARLVLDCVTRRAVLEFFPNG